MSRTWVYSDPHFYHKNIVKFGNYDGTKLRPWDDAEQMTEEMIEKPSQMIVTTALVLNVLTSGLNCWMKSFMKGV